MNIGEKIKDIRIQNGLTQSEFAKKIETTQTSVGLWEKGLCRPSLRALRAISETFEVPVKELTVCLR